jgi:hypothetical protein
MDEIPLPFAIIIAATVLAMGIVVAALIVARGLASGTQAQSQPAPFFPMPSSLPPLLPVALPVEPSGIAVDADTPLEVGSRVLADWNGIWWRAQVIGLESGGRVRVHYLGWEDRWDETVPRSRLQVDLSDSLGDG